MRQIPGTFSLAYYLDELEFTEAALAADPDAADLAPVFAEEIEGWTEVFQRSRAARREVVRADAVVAVRDRQLDAPTSRFATAALLAANNDRESETFRGFFPMAPSAFVRQSLRKQAERTRDVTVPKLEALAASSPLRAFAPVLAAAARGALAALTARAKVEGAAAVAASEAREWKEGINQLRTSTYGELLKRQAERDLGRGWADTFFRRDAPPDEATDSAPPKPSPGPA